MQKNTQNEQEKYVVLWSLELKELVKYWVENTIKLVFIFSLVLYKRGIDALYEIISGKVIIPLIFFFLATKIQIQGLDTVINSLIQLSTFAISSTGALIYKYKKDTQRVEK